MTQPIRFDINDKPVQADAGDADMALIDFLHERQDLTGTKFCCGIGVCRACTVATRGGGDEVLEKTLSCSTPVSAVENMSIYTVESLGSEQALAPLPMSM